MKLKKKTFDRLENLGYINGNRYPDTGLIIWNYTPLCQYDAHWNETTLLCRGLVTDYDMNIVARGLPKFFNYEEQRTNIPSDLSDIAVYEKMDGSYIQLFNYKGEWKVMSKGSFISEQAEWAKELFETKYPKHTELDKSLTYCFELIHPQNRIVVDYGDSKELIFITAFDTSGKEYDVNINDYGISECNQILSDFNYESLKKDHDNAEGWVVRFSNGERCKIKFEEYKRLHRIITNTTSYDVWDVVRLNDRKKLNEMLSRIPDEFYDWVHEVIRGLLRDFYKVKGTILLEYSKTLSETLSDAEYAKLVNDTCQYKSQVMSLWKGRCVDEDVWKMVKPKFQKAFQ